MEENEAPKRSYRRRIALGLDIFLDDFAELHGAETHRIFAKEDPSQWRHYLLVAISDPETLVFFNLRGVDIWGGIARAAAGNGGPTNDELLMIYRNEAWWPRIRWMIEGIPTLNPFE